MKQTPAPGTMHAFQSDDLTAYQRMGAPLADLMTDAPLYLCPELMWLHGDPTCSAASTGTAPFDPVTAALPTHKLVRVCTRCVVDHPLRAAVSGVWNEARYLLDFVRRAEDFVRNHKGVRTRLDHAAQYIVDAEMCWARLPSRTTSSSLTALLPPSAVAWPAQAHAAARPRLDTIRRELATQWRDRPRPAGERYVLVRELPSLARLKVETKRSPLLDLRRGAATWHQVALDDSCSSAVFRAPAPTAAPRWERSREVRQHMVDLGPAAPQAPGAWEVFFTLLHGGLTRPEDALTAARGVTA